MAAQTCVIAGFDPLLSGLEFAVELMSLRKRQYSVQRQVGTRTVSRICRPGLARKRQGRDL